MRYLPATILILAIGLLGGCTGGDKGDGIDPKNQQVLSDANAISKSVDGDFSKLTADQKQQFIKLANGNEAQAKTICYMMAHSPNEGLTQGRGGAAPKR